MNLLEHSFVIGIAVVLISVFPIVFSVAVWLHHLHMRTIRKLAQSTPCFNCGAILGEEAVRLANTEWASYVTELRKEHRGIRFRLVRNLHAICPQCGVRYTYLEEKNEFAAMEQETSTLPSERSQEPGGGANSSTTQSRG